MAAPTPTARGAVGGTRLDNGFQTLIVFSSNPTIEIYEKSVQPPSIDGGDPIMTDTMLNTVYITKTPQCLEEWGDIVVVAAYDPAARSEIQALINNPQSITVVYPDETTLTVWGYLRSEVPAALVKNTQPETTLTIVVTNYDPVLCVEAGPVLVAGTGSCMPCHQQ